MRVPAASRLAWIGWAFSSVFWLLYVLEWGLSGFEPIPIYADQPLMDVTVRVTGMVANAVITTVGALVAASHPRNPIGWMVLLAGVIVSFAAAAGEYAELASRGTVPATAIPWVLWLSAWLYAVTNAVTALVLLLFPYGRLSSRFWSPAVAATLLLGILQAVMLAIRPGPFPAAPAFANPLGVPEAAELAPAVISATTRGFVLLYLLASASLVARYVQARGELRRQLKWVALASTAYAVALAATYVTPPQWFPALGLLHYLLLTAQALSLGIALVHYRLYDIELVVNRALVYGALAVTITAAYVALAVGAGAFLGTRGEPDLWISLLATAGIAVGFEPLRRRVQLVANHLVYGERAEPYEVLANFSRRIAGVLSADEILPRMAEAAAQGVGAARSRIAVRIDGARDILVTWPDDTGAVLNHTVSVVHQGKEVGEIAVSKPAGDPLTATEARLLADLAAEAGPALQNVRLTFELRDRLEQLADQAQELQASRQRMVAAQDAERRRIERDLHDGAQQHLVALAVQLRLLKSQIAKDPAKAARLIDGLIEQTNDTLGELRALARGIFPALLQERGLVAAIQAHMAKSHPDAVLEIGSTVRDARMAPEVETAAYFCIREALQNVAKHAPGVPVAVRLDIDDGDLSFRVQDEGPGFDPSTGQAGTGMQGMADRLASVGGRLSVRTAPGAGTTVEGWVPIEADQEMTPVAAPQAELSASGPNSHLGRKAEAPHSSRRAA